MSEITQPKNNKLENRLRVKDYVISTDQMAALMKGQSFDWKIPADAEVVWFKMEDNESFIMRMRSAEFDEIPLRNMPHREDLR